MSTQLFFFAVDVIGFFSVLLFGLRVLVTSPKRLNARLLALICFNSACATVLARQDYAFWIPDAYQLHVGMLRIPRGALTHRNGAARRVIRRALPNR
jgi:hypothetical protein